MVVEWSIFEIAFHSTLVLNIVLNVAMLRFFKLELCAVVVVES